MTRPSPDRPPCPTSPPGAARCHCSRTTSHRLDREAAAFAKARGVTLEHERYKEGICGDARPSEEQRQSVLIGQQESMRLRECRERKAARAGALTLKVHEGREAIRATYAKIDQYLAEKNGLVVDVKILAMFLDGPGMDHFEIAASRSIRRSRAWVSMRLGRIRKELADYAGADVEPVPVACANPTCGCIVTDVSVGRGRPRKYHHPKCANAARKAKFLAGKGGNAKRNGNSEKPGARKNRGAANG